jgi:hypothetical protein
MALAINQCGGRVIMISVVPVLKGDGERGGENMVVLVMCKKNEVGNDRPKRERWKMSGEVAIANLDFLNGIKN